MKWNLKRVSAKIVILIVLITACIFGVWQYVNTGSPAQGWVYLRQLTEISAVADSISSVTNQSFGNRVAVILKAIPGVDYPKAGAYRIGVGESALQLAVRLKNGTQTPVKFTFNNVRTITDLANRVSNQLMMSDADFLDAITDTAFLNSHGITKEQLPSLFIPDTYEMYWTVSPKRLLSKLDDNYKAFWNETRLKSAKELGLTPAEVATVASIVEEETNKTDERRRVAGLYLNRLGKGMLLQADPTVKFAIGDFARKRILHDDLLIDSPYNTYKYQGLPPGPIRIPEKSTVDAVLGAERHPYLYMCAKDDFSGYHNFASDIATHNANAARYRRALNARGIRK